MMRCEKRRAAAQSIHRKALKDAVYFMQVAPHTGKAYVGGGGLHGGGLVANGRRQHRAALAADMHCLNHLLQARHDRCRGSGMEEQQRNRHNLSVKRQQASQALAATERKTTLVLMTEAMSMPYRSSVYALSQSR